MCSDIVVRIIVSSNDSFVGSQLYRVAHMLAEMHHQSSLLEGLPVVRRNA